MKIDIGTNEHVTIAKNGTDICNLDQLDDIIVDELVDLGLYSLPPDPPRYLTLTANQDNSTVRIDKNGTPYELLNADIKYSIDGGTTWNDYTFTNADGLTITLNNGQSVKFKGNNAKFSIDGTYYYRFFLSGSFAGSGDVTSLLNGVGGNARITDYCFNNLFSGSMALTTAPELPATTLGSYCCYYMFKGCSSLTTAPALPATTLANYCYNSMFQNCTSLTTAPELPATTLATSCYNGMFNGCTSLTTAPELPATTLASNCYYGMFQNCSNLNYIKAMFTTTPSSSYTGNWVSRVASTGTFVKNSAATWNVTGTNGVPSGWTVQTASS